MSKNRHNNGFPARSNTLPNCAVPSHVFMSFGGGAGAQPLSSSRIVIFCTRLEYCFREKKVDSMTRTRLLSGPLPPIVLNDTGVAGSVDSYDALWYTGSGQRPCVRTEGQFHCQRGLRRRS
jgi:hypothetical protein